MFQNEFWVMRHVCSRGRASAKLRQAAESPPLEGFAKVDGAQYVLVGDSIREVCEGPFGDAEVARARAMALATHNPSESFVVVLNAQ